MSVPVRDSVLSAHPGALVVRQWWSWPDRVLWLYAILADDTGRLLSNWCLDEETAWQSALALLQPRIPAPEKPRSGQRARVTPVKAEVDEVVDLF